MRVPELSGMGTFDNVDLFVRRRACKPPGMLALDIGRLPLLSARAARMLADFLLALGRANARIDSLSVN